MYRVQPVGNCAICTYINKNFNRKKKSQHQVSAVLIGFAVCIPSYFYAVSTGCQVGYYGDKCLSACSILSPGCARCSQDGQCTACRDGFVNPPSCTGKTSDGLVCQYVCVGGGRGSIVSLFFKQV